MPRPNILFIMTDQQCADMMSCAGAADVHTPAMDAMAANGVRFSRAYCGNPICVPSRAGMFSGRMPHELNVFTNVQPVRDSMRFPMLGRVMSDAGYECMYIGKWHLTVPMDQNEVHGFPEVRHPQGPGSDARVPGACAEWLSPTP